MKRLWAWLRMLAALGILLALGWRFGTGAFLDGLRAITAWSIVAALGIGLLTTVFSAWRWCVVARGLGLTLKLRSAVSAYYLALVLNAVLPAGVLGDVHRALDHGQQSGDVGRGVRAVVFERFAGQVVLGTIGIGVLFTQPRLITALAGDISLNRTVVVIVLVVLVVGLVVLRRRTAVRRTLELAWTDARSSLLSRKSMPSIVLLSAATVVGHVAMFLVAARVAGSSATVGQLIPVIVLALVVMALPVNVGGWGPREAFLAVAFGAAGLGAAQGITTAVAYGVLAMVASLPGALVLIARLRKDRKVVAERLDQPREKVPALLG